MNIREKLLNIQKELVAPKRQYNSFGKYNYRNCEDILEAVKPLLEKNKCTLLLKDEIVLIGDRYYVKAIAKLADTEDADGIVEATAYAREEENKKGMDGSQVTGASSSYARKYALNGLFCIDDTKDSDTTNKAVKKLSDAQIKRLYAISSKAGYNAEQIKQFVFKKYEKEIETLTKDEYDYICRCLEKKGKQEVKMPVDFTDTPFGGDK